MLQGANSTYLIKIMVKISKKYLQHPLSQIYGIIPLEYDFLNFAYFWNKLRYEGMANFLTNQKVTFDE